MNITCFNYNKKILIYVCLGFLFALTGYQKQNNSEQSNTTQSQNSINGQTLALGQEYVEPGEQALIDNITQVTVDRIKKEYPPDKRPARRDAHPKMHGLVRAQCIILDDIPDSLKIGLFKTPKSYDTWIRFSAGGTIIQSDTTQQAHGMAVKLIGVEGEKILEDEKDAKTMDFVMINYPGFISPNLPNYDSMNTAITNGDPSEFFKTHPEEAKATFLLNNQPFYNPLQVQYYSEVPYKLGPYAVKYSARPISNSTNAKVSVNTENFFTTAMQEQLDKEDVYFELMIQVQVDPVKMPVENSLIIWDENLSPFRRVAILRIPKQTFTSPEQFTYGDNLSFAPWHTLPEHRPLGSINRTRRVVYETISKLRHQMNNVPMEEPTSMKVF